MHKLLFLLLFFQFQNLTAQTLSGVVFDEYTKKPIANAKLLIYNNNYTKSIEVISDATGYMETSITEFCKFDSLINIRLSKTAYQTSFFSIKCQATNIYQDFEVKRNSNGCRLDTAFAIYKPGQIELNCDEFYKLAELTNALREELPAIVMMTFYYSPQEKDGYNLSLARANFISGFISKYGAISENYTIRILKGENSMVKLSGVQKK